MNEAMNETMNEWKINEYPISPWGQSWEGVFLKHTLYSTSLESNRLIKKISE